MRAAPRRSQGSPIPGCALLFRAGARRGTVIGMDTKITVITGANRGLGRAAALALAAKGADTIVTYRGGAEEAAATVAAVEGLGRRAAALRLDTTDTAAFAGFAGEVRATLGAWGRDTFDVLVNNAGSAQAAPFAELSEAQFDEMFGVHVKGPYFLTQTLLPLLADGGSIVNLSTGLTRFATEGYSAYGAAKGAVDVLTRYQALELGPRRIAVNAIAPGPVGTDFGGGHMRDDPALREVLAAHAAMGRVGEPEDIGAAIAGLVTDTGGWITGQRIEVSGGTRL
jgi:NAD(P)-dependent dehydrogenase (short-subunit alcohol dehydrogenase family)